jgi:3-hydroxyacyl-CoA dehydrogenase
LTGIPAYAAVIRDLFPDLDCSKEVPKLMREVVESGAQGVANAKGFYKYAPAESRRWEKNSSSSAMKFAPLRKSTVSTQRPKSDFESPEREMYAFNAINDAWSVLAIHPIPFLREWA